MAACRPYNDGSRRRRRRECDKKGAIGVRVDKGPSGMDLWNSKYDYVEDAGNDWDLTTDSSVTTSTPYKQTSASPLLRRRLSEALAPGNETHALYHPTTPTYKRMPWRAPHSTPKLDDNSTDATSTAHLMDALHASRHKRSTPPFTIDSSPSTFTFFADNHLAAWADERRHHPTKHSNDLIPLSSKAAHTIYDGRVAKHKRIGELLGVAKPPGPWTHPSTPSSMHAGKGNGMPAIRHPPPSASA
ncbi:hypothetical protein H310_09473 [Aphanomyces invadans]|uniref:Uncharacterized protein n=1 Tax=Aphanomyces invadans TaxID=157072 RepID=A0A024TUA1_9STRA|nr:hypothetical protein H310_09473 [Aphanomyces invadans]ETV97569.1 hypothetical protein H310_09473 [Aphanomyces invadans]|eukprot:XP_008873778.1 hypothetical protein H310_09473 [Aphanomyces invadans]